MASPPPSPPISLPTTSALDMRTQAFPILSADQIDRIRPCGTARKVTKGEILFEPSDSSVPFFVLLSGAMEIVQPGLDGEQRVAAHAAGEFTGEMASLSRQQSLVRGRVTENGEFLELSMEALRSVVAKDAQLSEVLMRAFILRRLALISSGLGNVILMGSRHSAQTLHLREFLSRNGHPFTYVDLDTDRGSQELLDRFGVKASEIPVVVCHGRNVLRSPSTRELADCLGFNTGIDGAQVRDVIIVGAGPAGLGAAVYGASEGLDVLLIETNAPGGQAGSSSKIENYLGFPTGVSGEELAARAINQAVKFGATMMIARTVVKLHCERHPYEVELDGGERLRGRSIVIATGATYNKPPLENLQRFEGEGVYYGATRIEAQLCGTQEAVVVGGGNSAGQAASYLSQTASKLHILVRSGELSGSMSRYLIQRLTENPRVDLHLNTEIVALDGKNCLEKITWLDKKSGETSTHDIGHLFIMAGASPCTSWLKGCLAMDDKGFILTGRDLDNGGGEPRQMLETSLPGVFAVGDVRSGNVKRVASAVGEGSICISLVHRALAGL